MVSFVILGLQVGSTQRAPWSPCARAAVERRITAARTLAPAAAPSRHPLQPSTSRTPRNWVRWSPITAFTATKVTLVPVHRRPSSSTTPLSTCPRPVPCTGSGRRTTERSSAASTSSSTLPSTSWKSSTPKSGDWTTEKKKRQKNALLVISKKFLKKFIKVRNNIKKISIQTICTKVLFSMIELSSYNSFLHNVQFDSWSNDWRKKKPVFLNLIIKDVCWPLNWLQSLSLAWSE